MQSFITKDQWMLLDIQTKQKLVEVFGIIRSGFSEIRDNHVVTDGYTQDDLKVITLEKMNEYIGSEETSLLRAWEITLSKINFELNPPVAELKGTNQNGTVIVTEPAPVAPQMAKVTSVESEVIPAPVEEKVEEIKEEKIEKVSVTKVKNTKNETEKSE